MAYKKTCWYTVIAPLRIGVICGAPPGPAAPLEDELTALIELGHLAGIAFQISDDLLNLEADPAVYGKESSGDLLEGKRTIMLLHFVRSARAEDRARALRLLHQPRREKPLEEVAWLREAMVAAGSLEYGRMLAREYSHRALEVDARGLPFLADNDDRRFLSEMLRYVIDRHK
jgi:geranylgeranyl diphosphate synthase type II